jgi:hypothetical protein
MAKPRYFFVANLVLLDDTAMKQEAIINKTFRMVPYCDCSALTADHGLLPEQSAPLLRAKDYGIAIK